MRNLPASQLNHIVREMQQGTAAAPEPTNVSEGGITAITPYRPAHQAAGSAAPKVVVTMIAGEALSTGNVVWISADNTVK